ncbi:MAG: polysaccharide pyruvyl transferase family protein [Ruminococcus sp.]|nr:polysaccharide pyruvyl transferase family protein [Ruminococcus sp.]
MRILTAAFFDDNYGDMLIRTCFLQLTKVALQNLGISDYTLDVMPLKAPDDEQIVSADLIVFAGGAMFGINYLGVASHIEHVLQLANERGIPVMFSSLGMNQMETADESYDRLHVMLSYPCIRAFSVRDSDSLFRRYAGEQSYTIQSVCDPAVWIGSVYAQDIADALASKKSRSIPLVGINVVRGGLFKDNGVDWTLTKEEEYLCAFSQMLEQRGIDYRFFTNGSTWDINTLRHFEKKYQIPREKLIISETSREVVQAIASFDAVIAIRMHASIIAYALSVPSVNYIWNPKIPDLYRKIGYPQRAVAPQDWSAETAVQMTEALLKERDYHPDPAVLMTLYRFLYDSYAAILAPTEAPAIYDHDTVCERLRKMTVPADEDTIDMRTKLKRAESRYYALFISDDRKKGDIRRLKKDSDQLRRQLEIERSKRQKAEKERDAALSELKRLSQKRSFRAYKKIFDHNNT